MYLLLLLRIGLYIENNEVQYIYKAAGAKSTKIPHLSWYKYCRYSVPHKYVLLLFMAHVETVGYPGAVGWDEEGIRMERRRDKKNRSAV
jgi:hypothetical protein